MTTKTTVLTVADLHRSTALLEALREAVVEHKPDIVALVGDFLHGFDDNRFRVSVLGCAKLLFHLPCPEIVFVRGNHEDDAWFLFAEAWKALGRPLHALHGEVFAQGPMMIVGFPCSMGDEHAFLANRAPLPIESEGWLPGVMLSAGPAARTLWLMHEPPTGTPLSQRGSLVEGNPDWVTAIERFSPWLSIAGHDHLTPIRSKCWHHHNGQTTCVFVGQTDHGPLHYCLVEAEFESQSPSLPAKMQVTAYPWQETLAIPSGKVISRSGSKPVSPVSSSEMASSSSAERLRTRFGVTGSTSVSAWPGPSGHESGLGHATGCHISSSQVGVARRHRHTLKSLKERRVRASLNPGWSCMAQCLAPPPGNSVSVLSWQAHSLASWLNRTNAGRDTGHPVKTPSWRIADLAGCFCGR